MGYIFGLFALFIATTSTVISPSSARAVNISNTWMLPEEGFPVFYRYFRDRISWYEADAVCQFHHANLVTADTTSQYDAIRAYLKELDITDNVWIGLSKTSDKPNFMWTDFHPLSGEGHWQEAIPVGNDPVCAAIDPAADFLWKARSCGGPEVAAFICELPIPAWALGPRGCLLTELPSLTVLYIPEQSAVELTSDCGLDGTKRIACKGNADREDILKQLTCAISHEDFDDKSTKSPSTTPFDVTPDENSLSSKTTKPWIWTSNTIDIDYGMPTRHRRETEDTLSPISTKSTTDLSKTSTEAITNSPTNYDTEVASSMFSTATVTTTSEDGSSDTTLDASVSRESDKSTEVISTQDTNSEADELAETFITATATADVAEVVDTAAAVEDAGDFPSAINQGQLFSIIGNGTMFDIIELNETGTEDSKAKDIASIPKEIKPIHTTSKPTELLYTTVTYNKEPPVPDKSVVTNKSIKNLDKIPKKEIYKNADPKKSNYITKPKKSNDDKLLTKEVEMFPIISDTSIILNRTHRKDLPFIETTNDLDEDNTNKSPPKVDNAITNDLKDNHHHIEIKLHDEKGKNKTFIVTTLKRTSIPIDPKLDVLNQNAEKNNNESETISPPPTTIKSDSMLMKEQFLPKSLLGEVKTSSTINVESTEDSLGAEPEVPSRPNRQRQLTRPQRRSFYPYFFSRVLG